MQHCEEQPRYTPSPTHPEFIVFAVFEGLLSLCLIVSLVLIHRRR